MTSFAADPPTITDGDTFTLTWAAPCGFVTLAQKAKGPFQTLLPSTGSYVLRPGLDGYPTTTGKTVYEARNADTATPREATVTVHAKASTPTPTDNQPPTVSVAASAPGCHPTKASASATPTPCTVTCTATAADPDGDALGYAWSGCASGTASTATCPVADINVPHACSANVSDGHGHTVNASATVTGTNATPQQTGWIWMLDGSMGTGNLPANHPADGNLFFLFTPTDDDPRDVMTCAIHMQIGGCSLGSCTTTNWNLGALKIVFSTGASGGVCKFDLAVADSWGASSGAITQRFDVN